MKLNRVVNLRIFFSNRSLPPQEKSYLSQLLKGGISFGEKAARRIEQTYEMGDLYLDREVTDDDIQSFGQDLVGQQELGKNSLRLRPWKGDSLRTYGKPRAEIFDDTYSDIPILEAVGSMGDGTLALDAGDQIIDFITISNDWSRIALNANPKNLRIITGAGDSMQPTFSSGDLLLVDVSHKKTDIDGVYVLLAHDRLFIKRVQQRLTGEYEISSDNPSVSLKDTLTKDVQVLGRVVYAWNGKKL